MAEHRGKGVSHGTPKRDLRTGPVARQKLGLQTRLSCSPTRLHKVVFTTLSVCPHPTPGQGPAVGPEGVTPDTTGAGRRRREGRRGGLPLRGPLGRTQPDSETHGLGRRGSHPVDSERSSDPPARPGGLESGSAPSPSWISDPGRPRSVLGSFGDQKDLHGTPLT